MPLAPRLPRTTPKRVARAAVAEIKDHVPTRLRRGARPDPSGWPVREYLDSVAAGRSALAAPRRSGHEAVRLTRAMDGTLPLEAVLLARAIADAAPPVGVAANPTLLHIVDIYLVETLLAFGSSSNGVPSASARRLVVDQLRLLHQVTREVQQAAAEKDDHQLRIQEAFLKERFARPENQLDLGAPAARTGQSPEAELPRRSPATRDLGPQALAASRGVSHHRLDSLSRPTALLDLAEGSLDLRLALPAGTSAVLGAVVEDTSGAMRFHTATTRRFAARRQQRAFSSAQTDVVLTLPVGGTRRLLVHAATAPAAQSVEAVLFVAGDGGDRAELPTALTRRRGAQTTVIASAHRTDDGLFVRHESAVYPDLRSACTAFDHHGVTWLAPDTPAL